MPFGLRKPSAMFQRAMGIIQNGVKRKACLASIDDAIMFPKNYCRHFMDIAKVLTLHL